MRMLACLLPLPLIAAAPATKPAACPNAQLSRTTATTEQPLVHDLSQEPGAHQEVAVLRHDQHGCTQPVVIGENIGGKSPPVRGTAAPDQTSSTSRR
jgi:hypothetical protein